MYIPQRTYLNWTGKQSWLLNGEIFHRPKLREKGRESSSREMILYNVCYTTNLCLIWSVYLQYYLSEGPSICNCAAPEIPGVGLVCPRKRSLVVVKSCLWRACLWAREDCLGKPNFNQVPVFNFRGAILSRKASIRESVTSVGQTT